MSTIDTSYDLVRTLVHDAVSGNLRSGVMDGCGYLSIEAIDDALVEAAERVISNAENGYRYDKAAEVIDDGSADGQIGDPSDKASDLYLAVEEMIRLSNVEREMFWTSQDGQSSMSGGEVDPFTSRPQIELHRKTFIADLLGQCADENEREAIKAGRIDILKAA